MRKEPALRHKPEHPYEWIWEPLLREPGFVLRPMFGARSVYLDGKIWLCLTCSEEPWRGVLVCTDRERHAALQQEFSQLVPHSVLPKWLYLSEESEDFEATARTLVRLVRARDPRLGVLPKPKKRRAGAGRAPGRP